MTTDSPALARLLDALTQHGGQPPRRAGQEWAALCPAHDDHHPSLYLRGIHGQVLLRCRSHDCPADQIMAALGLGLADLYDDPKPKRIHGIPAHATYRYDDGRIAVRSATKKFTQTGNTKGTPQLYRLNKVQAAVSNGEAVALVEGEKDVHALESLGVTATTAPMGAVNIGLCDLTPLHGGRINVIPDQDDAGHTWAGIVADKLTGHAELTWLTPRDGKDAADHIAAGYGLADFKRGDPPNSQPQQSEPRTWLPIDLGPIVAGTYKPLTPDVGSRSDGIGMFYPGRCHTIASESEAGKSWLALHATAHELGRGNHVIYIDFEDEPEGVVGRLLTLQIHKEIVLERFHYLRPESPITDIVNHGDLAQVLHDHQPALVVVDGVTEGMTLHGLDPLSNKDAALFGRWLPTAVANQGPAVVSLDHVTKSAEGRGRYAIGAVHKLNGLNGAAYLLENRLPFGIGVKGKSTIKIAKDRPGQIRRHCLPSSGGLHWYGDLVLDSTDETFAELDVPAPVGRVGVARPDRVMAKLHKLIADNPKISGRQLQAIAGGKSDINRRAIALLEIEGYVTESPHTVIKPFQEAL